MKSIKIQISEERLEMLKKLVDGVDDLSDETLIYIALQAYEDMQKANMNCNIEYNM